MKRPNRELNVFNISMLDVMTGALGAVLIIMIVLLTQKIGIEAESCQDISEELKKTTEKLIKTTNELSQTKNELKSYKSTDPSIFEKILNITTIIDSTANKFKQTIKKITQIRKDLLQPKENVPVESDEDKMIFKIPKKVVLVIDLSGSMNAKRNKYKEDRLSQVKAALKMFIAGMDQEYSIDIVYFPAFAENIDNKKYPSFTIRPVPDKECLKYDMRDEAYDEMNLKCYKYGYFEGRLKNIKSKKDKYEFYKKIACLKAYHDTPTKAALDFILTTERYRDAQGIILFSDGQPDSIRKELLTMNEILDEIKKKNTSNKKIFSIGIGTEFRNQLNTEGVKFLKDLSKQNNGFYIGF